MNIFSSHKKIKMIQRTSLNLRISVGSTDLVFTKVYEGIIIYFQIGEEIVIDPVFCIKVNKVEWLTYYDTLSKKDIIVRNIETKESFNYLEEKPKYNNKESFLELFSKLGWINTH